MRTSAIAATVAASSGAASHCVIAQVRGRSAVVRSRAQPPLQLRHPANHGAGAWIYLASLGGGFVGADDVALALELGAGATAFLASPSSSKIYRGATARFRFDARVGDGATLVAWPAPVTGFAGARFTQHQRIALAPTASLLLVDAFTAGRIACDERWAFDRLEARLHVDVGGAPWLRDGLVLAAAHGALAPRLAGLDAIATVVLVGPRFHALAAATAAALTHPPGRDAVIVAASPRDGGLIVRLAAPTVAALHARLRALLRATVADVLGDDPLARAW